MRIWCAHCKRVQDVHITRSRRRRVIETLAGRVGVCAVCGYPVSAIGTALGRAHRVMPEPSLSTPQLWAAHGAA